MKEDRDSTMMYGVHGPPKAEDALLALLMLLQFGVIGLYIIMMVIAFL